jgi:hypothetical protein
MLNSSLQHIDYFLPSESEALGVSKTGCVASALDYFCGAYPKAVFIVKVVQLYRLLKV